MSNQKVKKLISLFPQQAKEIFVQYAKFQNLREVPEKNKEDYFDKYTSQIAQKFVSYYTNKSIQDLDPEKIITDLMDWLETTDVKFKVPQKKEQSKQIKRPSVSPKPVRAVNDSNNIPESNPYQKALQNQRRLATTPPKKYQGVRQFNVSNQQRQIKKQHRQRQFLGNQHQFHGHGHQQRTKESDLRSVWTKLSQCLQYPQKRFYIFPQMMKYNKKY